MNPHESHVLVIESVIVTPGKTIATPTGLVKWQARCGCGWTSDLRGDRADAVSLADIHRLAVLAELT